MNYLILYNNIIEKARFENRNKRSDFYFENHHIIPKCLGGSNKKENLVLLTAKEHYICHKLLVELYPKNKSMIYALHRMTYSSNKDHHRDYKISSKEYERLRILHSESLRGDKNPMMNTKMKGEDHPMYGRNHSKESRNLISENHSDVSGSNNPMYGKTGTNSPIYGRLVKEKNPMYDKTIYKFYHEIYGYEECTRNEFVEKYNLCRQYVRLLCKNEKESYKGWKLCKSTVT